MGEAVRLPAETDTVSPAQTNKRCRNATSGAGPSKILRFVTNMTSVTMVRTHADGTESTARLDGLPAISKRTREGEDGRMEVKSVKRAKATTRPDDRTSNASGLLVDPG